ncbi:hypothetical protein DFJ74DRAFT_707963 [Hyaloraphidium curvatum]|nr:hypothetical protein DFJ74DRAFT_707963 [Hyaloraphidium curvatum]
MDPLAAARVRAEESFSGGSPSHSPAVERWFAVGDPQCPFDRFLRTLASRGLVSDEGWLRPDVGLVSMGDHFDFLGTQKDDPENRATAGREGLLNLSWLAAHEPEQVVIILGNHDAVRVMELAKFSDASFRAARKRSFDVKPEEVRAFCDEFDIAEPGILRRDFSTFTEAQRDLVKSLLLARRYRLATTAQHGGDVLLMNHAGTTRRELHVLGLSDESGAKEVAAALQSSLDRAVDRVVNAWRDGGNEALNLEPLHFAGVASTQPGGLMAHRPANPAAIADSAWGFAEGRPRRYDVSKLPLGFSQIVGHTNGSLLRKNMGSWGSGASHSFGHCHTLHFGRQGVEPEVEIGIRPAKEGGTRVIYLDPGLAYVGRDDEVEIMELDGPVYTA